MHQYTRKTVGHRVFTIPTTSKRINFRVVIFAEHHGYANGARTEWSATVWLWFDDKIILQERVTAAEPPGADLDTATDEQIWSVLNLPKVTRDLIQATCEHALGPVWDVLDFGVDNLREETKQDLKRYRDFEHEIQTITWASVPGQTIVAASNINVDDVVVERNHRGNVTRYAYVEDINTTVDDDGETRVQFVHARDVPHPTSAWYREDTLLEVVKSR